LRAVRSVAGWTQGAARTDPASRLALIHPGWHSTPRQSNIGVFATTGCAFNGSIPNETRLRWLTGAPPEFLGAFVVVNLLTLVLLLLVWVVYRLAMPILIERMSA
jgi:hypothetical protein